MSASRAAAWQRAREVAREPSHAAQWRVELAAAVEAAVRPHAAAVCMCALGNMLDASVAVAPPTHQPLGERLISEFLPAALQAGALSPWSVLSPAQFADRAAVADSVRVNLLSPAGFSGIVSKFMRAESGIVLGWTSVFMRESTDSPDPELLEQLAQICCHAAETVRRSLSIAASAGARAPQLSLIMLSKREREVAALAIKGLSDLNISRRLGISEGTVGRHLHSIFRKLGVHSRADLCRRAGASG